MPTIVVSNKSDSLIQITPIDDTHKAPAALGPIGATLPPGSFMVTNQTATPIHVVITLWSFIDRDGNTQQKRFNCDGYITGGVPTEIVRGNDSTLITPGGCTMREYFAHMAAGKPMLGTDLLFSINKPISEKAATLDRVRITVDSVIFADGRIWGPDAKQYYKTVSAEYWGSQSVVEEVLKAKAAGQEVRKVLERILAEPSGSGYQSHRKLCASVIHDSADPEFTLKFYSEKPPLPEFQHVEGETK